MNVAALVISGIIVGFVLEWILLDYFYYHKAAPAAGQDGESDKLKAELASLKSANERLVQENADLRSGSDSRDLTELQARHDALMAHSDQLALLADQHRAEAESLRAQIGGSTARPIPADAPDPLIDIDGIGKVFQQRLYDAGVTHFSQLASMTPDSILEIVKPESWQKVEVENWIAEATSFASGAKLL